MNFEQPKQTPYSGDPSIPYIRLNAAEKENMHKRVRADMKQKNPNVSETEVIEEVEKRIRESNNRLASNQLKKERKIA